MNPMGQDACNQLTPMQPQKNKQVEQQINILMEVLTELEKNISGLALALSPVLIPIPSGESPKEKVSRSQLAPLADSINFQVVRIIKINEIIVCLTDSIQI